MARSVQHYIRNFGWLGTLQNLFILAFFAYLALTASHPGARIVIGGVIIVGLLVPRLFLFWIVPHATGVMRLGRGVWYATIVLIILHFTRVMPLEPLAAIGIMTATSLLIGTQLWLYSHPDVMTQAGYQLYEREIQEHIERELALDEHDEPDEPTPAV